MRIIKPKKLKKGDTVGIVSPSEPITELKEQFETGVKFLEELGLKVKVGKNVFANHYYNAGTKEQRIEDFNEIWKDPKVKMILMSQGGETANHLLDGIDYEYIKKNPKIFAGISDGTTLLTAIHAKTGLITYHGPDLLWSLGRPMSNIYKENFIKTFFDGNVKELKHDEDWKHEENETTKDRGWRTLRKGKISGRLIGGHSGCFITTIFAGFEPNYDNTILFLEGTDDPGHLDRQFTAMKLRGIFEKINGLVIGWFEDFDDYKKNNPKKYRESSDIIMEVTKDYNFPILEINELGHNVPNYIFPIGVESEIDLDKKVIRFKESLVS